MSHLFAARLKAERKRLGWTQSYLANTLGISNGTISGYERNYREPDIETLWKLADLFNVSIDYLVGKVNDRIYYSSIAEKNAEYDSKPFFSPKESSEMETLPEAAIKEIEDFKNYIKHKYKKTNDF